jgi:preprotein translocase subunit SecG
MLYALVLGVHVVVSLVLVFVVLLQAGRGGGFSDMLGGGQPQSLFGTQTNAFMVKATEVCAVVFILTSLTLGILSTQKGKSLVGKQPLPGAIRSEVPTVPQPPTAPPKLPEAPPLVPESAPAETNAAS